MDYYKKSKKLFSKEGQLIKKLYCPVQETDRKITLATDHINYHCSICHKTIIETKFKSEKELINLLQDNPNTCLKISNRQSNINIHE